ncbi:MAG: hypothetical protein GX633_10130 [Clostridiales bacterium]|nr:hypothetical protein [Clostridiales bacterium]
MRFLTPVDGDMLSNVSGKIRDEMLFIEVDVAADEGKSIEINSVPAIFNDGKYSAIVPLYGYRNTLEVVDKISGESIIAGVYWLKNAAKKYSLSVDDNIFFLCDITKNKDIYTSIFDNPYLAVYKKAHDLYGAKVRINLFYSIDEKYEDVFGKFNLSMMTDKFKCEWVANSDWLHLAFHSYNEFPDRPYLTTSYEKIINDYRLIIGEIKRFAGEECIERATTFHWGASNRTGVRAVRAQGIGLLMGYLDYDKDGNSFVSYYLTPKEIDKANVYGFWKDHSEDMIFGKIDCVLNTAQPAENIAKLEKSLLKYPKKGFIELMIHEQYFYPFYVAYMENYAERILTACEWCVNHGYTASFASDVVFED